MKTAGLFLLTVVAAVVVFNVPPAFSDACLVCHGNPALAKTIDNETISLFTDRDLLSASVHAGMACAACHTGLDAGRIPHAETIAQVECGRCHTTIAATYRDSIHGKAVAKGNEDAPTCADCHGRHHILRSGDPLAVTAGKNVTEEICADCHDSVLITSTYGIASDRFRTFYDSRHGLMLRAGNVEAVNCASCHGIHNIKPSSDPDSPLHPSNIPATCGVCHPGANENFARGSIHMPPPSDPDSGILYWIRAVYLFMIIAIVGGMLVHNLSHFIRKTRYRFAVRQRRIVPERYGTTSYLRMTLVERIQHALMKVSFILLAVTGFMTRYPDAWWVAPFRLMSENFYQLRAYVHKTSAAVLIAVGLWHIIWLFTTDRGKQFRADILPMVQDVADGWKNLLHLMGLSPVRPLFGRFRYIEKIEYWAMIWGMAIMSVTGVILWFNNYFLSTITKLGLDIARTVHFYEACLAVLAVVAWHFYFVILNPDVFPMDTCWITGTVSEAEMAEHHPLELERLKKSE